MDTKTKPKRDLIKQKNRAKATHDFRFLRYARVMCIVVPIIFISLILLSTNSSSLQLQTMITENPMLIVGFITCIINLLNWRQLGILLEYLREDTNIEAIRFELILMALSQLALYNYVSFILVLVSLYKYLPWSGYAISKSIKQLKETKQVGNVVTLGIVLLLLVALGLFIQFLVAPLF